MICVSGCHNVHKFGAHVRMKRLRFYWVIDGIVYNNY